MVFHVDPLVIFPLKVTVPLVPNTEKTDAPPFGCTSKAAPLNPDGTFIPKAVPLVLHVVTAVVPVGWIKNCGKLVVLVPPVRIVPLISIGDTDAAPFPVTETIGSVTVPVKVGEAIGASRVAEFDTHVVHVPVRFVITPEAGVPRAGVTRVGDVSVPVIFVRANAGAPVRFVATPDTGVPSAGDTSVGLLASTTPPVPVGVLASVAVTAPVDAELLRMVPSPVNDETPLAGIVQVDPRVHVCPLTVVAGLANAELGIAEAATASNGVVVGLVTVGVSHDGQFTDGAANNVTVPEPPPPPKQVESAGTH